MVVPVFRKNTCAGDGRSDNRGLIVRAESTLFPARERENGKMKALNEFMAGLHTGEAVEFNRLKIMPILVDEDRTLPFVDLEEALKKGFVVITEISEGGSGPDLEGSNRSEAEVFILDGEELIE